MTDTHRIARAMTALSHPRRVAIFQALKTAGAQGLSVPELLAEARLRPSTLTHHLKPMFAAGLVRRRRMGLPIRLYLDGRAVGPVIADVAARIALAPRPRHPALAGRMEEASSAPAR